MTPGDKLAAMAVFVGDKIWAELVSAHGQMLASSVVVDLVLEAARALSVADPNLYAVFAQEITAALDVARTSN